MVTPMSLASVRRPLGVHMDDKSGRSRAQKFALSGALMMVNSDLSRACPRSQCNLLGFVPSVLGMDINLSTPHPRSQPPAVFRKAVDSQE